MSPRFAGWLRELKDALAEAVRGYSAHAASQQAAAISFRVLFSLVPLTALVVAVVDLVLPPDRREEVVEWVIDRLSGSAGLEDSVRRALTESPVTASVAGLIALGGLIWAASGMMSAIRRAFAVIWEADAPVPFLRGKLVDFVVVLGAGLVAIAGFGLAIVVEAIYEVGSDIGAAVGIESAGGWIGALTATASSLIMIFGCFAALYRLVPPVAPSWRALWPGAVVGSVGFQLATTAYGVYLSRFGDLSVVYGSLGALLGFLLVVWAGSIAMLVGAEVVARWPKAASQ